MQIIATPDGGNALLANTISTDGDVTGLHMSPDVTGDIWVCKLDAGGQLQWQRALGGTGNEAAASIINTKDGGYAIMGWTTSSDGDVSGYHGGKDLWIVKLSDNGDLEWQKALGGTWDEQSITFGDHTRTTLTQTQDGGFALVGVTSSSNGDVVGQHGGDDIWLVKLSGWGELLWQRTVGGSNDDIALYVLEAATGDLYVNGSTASTDGDVTDAHNIGDGWILKFSASGELLWQRALGGSDRDDCVAMVLTPDGGVFAGCNTASGDGDVTGWHGLIDSWVVKLEPDGGLAWQRTLGGTASDQLWSLLPAEDGGCLMMALTFSSDGDVIGYHGDSDLWAVKLDADGEMEWGHAFGGSSGELPGDVAPRPSGGWLLFGTTTSTDGDVEDIHANVEPYIMDGWAVAISEDGALDWQRCVGGTHYDVAISVNIGADSGCVLALNTNSSDGDVLCNHAELTSDVWVVKLGGDIHTSVPETEPHLFRVGPNPASATLSLELPSDRGTPRVLMIDSKGRIVRDASVQGPTWTLDVASLARGLYTVVLSGDHMLQQRVVLE